jgi:hypothetical protein
MPVRHEADFSDIRSATSRHGLAGVASLQIGKGSESCCAVTARACARDVAGGVRPVRPRSRRALVSRLLASAAREI